MMTIREYARPATLEEAWQLNQKKPNRVLGGMLWLKMEKINVGTAIDLSGLGLDTIEETDEGFSIGAMVTLRQLESCTPASSPIRTVPCGSRCATSWASSCATSPPWAAAFTAASVSPTYSPCSSR